jgi:hypothetical protein
MKRLVAVMLFVLVSLATPTAAQEARVDAGAADPPGVRALSEGIFVANPNAGSPLLQAPRPIPTVRTALRRRGSMVGYVEDAVIGTKLRIRYETATENDVPDRAEFFYAKCGCYRDLIGDPAFDPEAPGPRPGAASDIDYQQFLVQGEYAAGNRLSLFAELPVRWLQPQAFLPGTGGPFPDQTGLSDIRAGVKLALASTDTQAITLQVKAFLPTGESEKGLGTNHASLEPAVLMYHRVSERASIESQVGIWYPLSSSDGVPITSDEKFAGSVFFYGIGPSVDVYRSSRVAIAPVVELVGWHVLDGMQTAASGGDAGGINIVNLKVGARLEWDGAGSIYGGWGRALTEQHWYHDIVRFEYRLSF